MTHNQIDRIIEGKSIPYPTEKIQLEETHISWVILSDDYVFKIKKQVKFDFLDFSTLAKRKYYCEQEVKLNRRLAPSMYLGVSEVKKTDNKYHIGDDGGTIVDYAVLMKRMDESRQLDRLLEQGNISKDEIIQLADLTADFHKKAAVVPEGADWKKLYKEFEDISSIQDFLVQEFGEEAGKFIEDLNGQAHEFLKMNKERIKQRNENGSVIDGHGDLHARNIFLLEEPVIFDCIEFNKNLRQGDRLNEIAFLCMDLERYNRSDLSKIFSERYLSKTGSIETQIDRQLFLFYKLYRANVRLKVLGIDVQESNAAGEYKEEDRGLISRYLELCKKYSKDLKST